MRPIPYPDRLFVGTVPSRADLAIIDREHWYRVPVDTVRGEPNWPPAWFAPWETATASGGKGQQIRALWRVTRTEILTREEIFPGQDPGSRKGKRYYRLALDDPALLPVPLLTFRRRQSVFIYTDIAAIETAATVNDLWWNGPLEGDFWEGLKGRRIPAERQWPTYGEDSAPAIFDFAIFCMREDIDVEVDGEQHHVVPEISRDDSRRDNASQLKGYRTLRFDARRVRRDLDRCLDEVQRMIVRCGGLEHDANLGSFWPAADAFGTQLPLFGAPVNRTE